MVQNKSRIGRNRSGMVPDTSGTLLDHFWKKHVFAKKLPNSWKRPDVRTPFFGKSIFPKNVKTQWDFLTNRELELIYKAKQMRTLEVIWYKIVFFVVSFLCVKSSKTHFRKVGFQAFLLWVDINSKIGSKNDLPNKKCPRNVICHEKCIKTLIYFPRT